MSKLPVEVLPNTKPPIFRWRQTVTDGAGMPRVTECSGRLPASVESAVAELVGIAERLEHAAIKAKEELAKLQAFKDWVHAYLDRHGVPNEFPDGAHSKKGCRIGDRMDWLIEQLDAANRKANAAQTLNSNQRQMLDEAKAEAKAPRGRK